MTRDEYIAAAKALPKDVWDIEGVDDDMLADLGQNWVKHLANPDFSAILKVRNEVRGDPKSIKQ